MKKMNKNSKEHEIIQHLQLNYNHSCSQFSKMNDYASTLKE